MRHAPLPGRRAALIVGHPGHELRVHHWIEIATPIACVLTDGSGHTARSRLASTTDVLTAAGATPGPVYGRFTDAEVYDAIRRGDVAPFVAVIRTMVDMLVSHDIDYIAADAIEGFNPSHDLCRYIVNAAVGLVLQHHGRLIGNFDFLLDGAPAECPVGAQAHAVRLELDEAALARKLTAARGYQELRGETESALERFGSAAFATELLRPVSDLREGLDALGQEPPYYEAFGEQQVRAGVYDSVIRYRAHVRPFVQALWRQAGVSDAVTDTMVSSASGRAS
jgi:hypothetical protein